MLEIREIYKTLEKLSRKWEPYFEVYDRHLSRFRNKQPTILEIGVAHGGSIEMWLKYFGAGTKVFGIDADPRFIDFQYNGNVELTLGDQADTNFWAQYLENKPSFDFVLDDGGHLADQQRISLQCLFPKLKNGGVYIIEDTHTSYWPAWGGGFRKPDTMIEVSKGLVDLLHKESVVDTQPNPQLESIFTNLKSISYYNSMIVFEKDHLVPFVEAVSST